MSDSAFRKQLAAQLAETITDSTTLPLLQLLCHGEPHADRRVHGLGPFASLAEDSVGLMTSLGSGPRSVGIWEQEPGTGDFVRSRAHVDLWRFCADVDRIPRRGDRKRIVLLGESVARGFFYDPFYSPAGVLQELLSSPGTPVEVVDLAQSNCDPWWLSVVASSTSLLQPDAIVVFAGNNWWGSPLANLSAERCAVDGPLLTEEGGFSELLIRQRRELDAMAAQTVVQLSLAAADARAPLILVVPELNLADWTNCPAGTLDLPLLSDDGTRGWITAYEGAAKALGAGLPAEAERLARQALAHDGGTSSASLDLLARVQMHQGNDRDASATLRRSRDSTVGFLDGTRSVPGIFSSVADTIRTVGAEVGATIVDLPRVFADRSRGAPPGREMFLDYCHLTSEGIRVAMAATARPLVAMLYNQEIELPDLVEAAPSPTPEQESWAHLLACIHNAHWGQALETCIHHLRLAVECDPSISETGIRRVYDAFRRGTPPPLLSAFDELVQNEVAAVYLLGYGVNFRTLGLVSEHRLLSALLAVCPSLGSASPDPDFSLGHVSDIDLLHPHWSELTDANRWYHRGLTAAYHFESTFPFVCNSSRAVSLALTCRVPGACEPGIVSVELNGVEVAAVTVDHDWRSVRVVADADIVREGANQLTLRWPNVSRADARPRIRRDFETGQKFDVRTHFGHLHDLRLSVA